MLHLAIGFAPEIQPVRRFATAGVIIVTLAMLFILRPLVTSAAATDTFTPEIPLPGVFQGEQNADDSLLSRYIRAIYIYFVWVVGIIATVMVVYGGIKWVAAAGNPGQIKDARDIIDNAIIGVIIALVSIVLLNIINPKLTHIVLPKVNEIGKKYAEGLNIQKICDPEPRILCGQVNKVGKATVDGKEVDDYCMGTTCPRGGVVGYAESTRICVVDKDSKNNFRPFQDCTDALDAQGGILQVEQPIGIDGVQWRTGCGLGNPRDQVGGWCNGAWLSVAQDYDPQCYMLGRKALPKVMQGPIGFIPNICCPGHAYPCPHDVQQQYQIKP